MTELKPCPFCGGKVCVEHLSFGGKLISCPWCDIFVARRTGDAGDIESVWNKRVKE